VPEFPSVQRYLVRFNIHQLDKALLDAILTVLPAGGIDARKQLEHLRIEQRSVLHGPVDLLDRYYLTSAIQEFAQQEPEEMKITEYAGDYYKAYSPESKFLFLGEADHPVSLSITCRVPALLPEPADLSIEVNGECHGVASASHAWQTWEVHLPGRAVTNGLNEVTLRWGVCDIAGKRAIEIAADNMLAEVFPDLYPIFGEIHSLTASLVTASKTIEVYAESSELSVPS
jgi:hypothetical protein